MSAVFTIMRSRWAARFLLSVVACESCQRPTDSAGVFLSNDGGLVSGGRGRYSGVFCVVVRAGSRRFVRRGAIHRDDRALLYLGHAIVGCVAWSASCETANLLGRPGEDLFNWVGGAIAGGHRELDSVGRVLVGVCGECVSERGVDGDRAVSFVGQARDCFWLAIELVPDDWCEHGIVSLVQLGLVVSFVGHISFLSSHIKEAAAWLRLSRVCTGGVTESA